MEANKRRIKDLIMCPHCYSDLKWLEDSLQCPECNARFPIQNGAINFIDYSLEKTWDSEFQAEQMFNKTLTAKLYNAGKRLVNNEYKPRDHIREFMSGVRQDSIVVELGSGNRRLRSDVINVDIFPFPNVDLVADIKRTPFRDNTVEFAILDTVLEHVPEPHKVTRELHRILRPEGKVVCITPFVFPYHGYPKHYFNFSKDGLEFLFRDFSECKVEMNLGPIYFRNTLPLLYRVRVNSFIHFVKGLHFFLSSFSST